MTFTLIRRLLVVVALLALAGGNVFATPLCSSFTLVTLADYMSLPAGGCSIGDKVFSNFAYNTAVDSLGDIAPATTDISVTPTGPTIGLTFTFDANNTVLTEGFLDVDIQYLVQVDVTDNPGWAITSVYTEGQGGIDSSSVSATVNLTKNLCLGSSFDTDGETALNTCTAGTPVAPVSGENSLDMSNDTFSVVSGTIPLGSGQTTLGVDDVITLNGGTPPPDLNDNSAAILYATNEFNQTYTSGVPEPATFLLLGSALIGLGVLRRKRA
jgi:hypothetical protein